MIGRLQHLILTRPLCVIDVETTGTSVREDRIVEIAAITDRAALARKMGVLSRDGIDMPIGASVFGDLKNPDIMSAYVGQGGLGLPDRDYYLDDKNPKFIEARGKYVEHTARMLTLAGIPDAAAKAKAIYDLERKIAVAHWTQVEQRQVEKIYNPVPRGKIDAAYPGVDWTGLLTAQGLDDVLVVVLARGDLARIGGDLVGARAQHRLPGLRRGHLWREPHH